MDRREMTRKDHDIPTRNMDYTDHFRKITIFCLEVTKRSGQKKDPKCFLGKKDPLGSALVKGFPGKG